MEKPKAKSYYHALSNYKMHLQDILQQLKETNLLKTQSRPYINHSVEFKKTISREERTKVLQEVGWNVFFCPSEIVTGCDMLSDSGTSTMTNQQWAVMHEGDEAYGSNRGFFLLMNQINKTFGEGFFNNPGLNKVNAFIFHQGRPCEDALFSVMGHLATNQIIPSNGHFDTTEANIEANDIKAVNLFSGELKNDQSNSKFKGNMNTERLKKLLEESADKIPLVYLTITNNTGGGQPVSLANIREVSELAHRYDIPFFLDACRFAENAWFIKEYEEGQGSKSIEDIVKEMFLYADGFTISFKKDGLANMGGGLFLKEGGLFIKKYPQVPDALINYQIIKEANPSYGGMSGRDIMTLVKGLETIVKKEYLDHRIKQVQNFGNSMKAEGLPVLTPTGGHAVYMDMNKFFADTNLKPSDFGGVSFTGLLLAAYGHRACELGNFAFGSYNAQSGQEKFPEVNFVRFAIPRLRYEEQDLQSVVEACKELYQIRDKIPGVEVIHGKELSLRHFKARFQFKYKNPLQERLAHSDEIAPAKQSSEEILKVKV